jgi:pimeloyl-ACP methyl ester carboxylesterase
MILPAWLERALLDEVENPLFPLGCAGARSELARMRAEPRPLCRPVVILAGWRAPSLLHINMTANLAPLTTQGASMFAGVAYPWTTDFERNARSAVGTVERRWPSTDREFTTEVDVIGVSMGGLVARLAARTPMQGTIAGSPGPSRKRLRIKRLFTLGTPHRGAWLAERFAIDSAAIRMRAGSVFLAALDEQLPDLAYELICYTRLHDEFVGATRTAPLGHHPRWVGGLRVLSHLTMGQDARLLADIARALRGEPMCSRGGSTPPRD